MKTSICEFRDNKTKECSCFEKCIFQDMKYFDDDCRDFNICKRPNTTGRKPKNDKCTHP